MRDDSPDLPIIQTSKPLTPLYLGDIPLDVAQELLDRVNAIMAGTGHGRVETQIQKVSHGFTVFLRSEDSERCEIRTVA